MGLMWNHIWPKASAKVRTRHLAHLVGRIGVEAVQSYHSRPRLLPLRGKLLFSLPQVPLDKSCKVIVAEEKERM
jgi:hypothetical protein